MVRVGARIDWPLVPGSTSGGGNDKMPRSGGGGGGGHKSGGKSPSGGGRSPGSPSSIARLHPTPPLPKDPTFYIGGTNGVALVEGPLQDIGWKRIADRHDLNFKLKWVECKTFINFNSFREGEQLVNHIPNCNLLTNKLGLLTSLQAYDRVCMGIRGREPKMRLRDVVPDTYRLDDYRERSRFFEMFKPGDVWICKPVGLNQGKGIYLVRDPDDFKKQLQEQTDRNNSRPSLRPIMTRIIQRYIKEPLLLNGKKFDIRAYMLIASTHPYLVLYHKGYVRLSMQDYDTDTEDLTAHLTNQFIQKKAACYRDMKEETAWSMDRFNDYINDIVAPEKGLEEDWVYNSLTKRMQEIILYCFNSVKYKLQCRVGYFGLFGLDFMVDQDMKVWLIEVNVNPCLATNCEALMDVIPDIVRETLYICIECFEKAIRGMTLLPLQTLHNFQVLYSASGRMFPHTTLRQPSTTAPLVAITPGGHVMQYRQKVPTTRSRSLSPTKDKVRGTMTSPMDLHFKTTSQVLAGMKASRHSHQGNDTKSKTEGEIPETAELTPGSPSSSVLHSSSSDTATDAENSPKPSAVQKHPLRHEKTVSNVCHKEDLNLVEFSVSQMASSLCTSNHIYAAPKHKAEEFSSNAISKYSLESSSSVTSRVSPSGSQPGQRRRTAIIMCSSPKAVYLNDRKPGSNLVITGKGETISNSPVKTLTESVVDQLQCKSNNHTWDNQKTKNAGSLSLSITRSQHMPLLSPDKSPTESVVDKLQFKSNNQPWDNQKAKNPGSISLSHTRSQQMPLLTLFRKAEKLKSGKYLYSGRPDLPSSGKTTSSFSQKSGNGESGTCSPDLSSKAITTAAFGKRFKRVNSLETVGAYNIVSSGEDRMLVSNNHTSIFRSPRFVNVQSNLNSLSDLTLSRFSCVQITKGDIPNGLTTHTNRSPTTDVSKITARSESPPGAAMQKLFRSVRPVVGKQVPKHSVKIQVDGISVSPSSSVISMDHSSRMGNKTNITQVHLRHRVPEKAYFLNTNQMAQSKLSLSTAMESIKRNPGDGKDLNM